MRAKLTIGPRGGITIPSRMREAFGMKANDELIIEETPQGLLLRPAVTVPIELYTQERIDEFTGENAQISKLLDERAGMEKKR